MPWSVRHVDGVGRLMQARLRAAGIRTLAQLRAHILALANGGSTRAKKRRLQDFVDTLTRNPRGRSCLEGYVPRIHNKFARDGLIHYMAHTLQLPANVLPTFRDKSRRPPLPGRPSPHFDWRVIPFEGGWAYPHGPRIPTATRRPRSYPFGKSDPPPAGLTRAQRNEALQNDPRYAARRRFPCTCFQSRETCEDFAPGRNRRDNRPPGSRLPACVWDGAVCGEFVPRRSERLGAGGQVGRPAGGLVEGRGGGQGGGARYGSWGWGRSGRKSSRSVSRSSSHRPYHPRHRKHVHPFVRERPEK